jgi:tRNA(Ile)-lysidine synthase
MIYQRLKKFVEANGLFSAESRLLVAVSGGQDSVALLHLLLELKKDWPELEMAMAHFNHQLRKSAADDERFVRKLARNYGLKIFVGRASVREFALKNQLNLEEAGRQLRYEFLEKTAEKYEADRILTAHTITDQAETVLMKIFRGTGIEGLQGIRLRTGKIVRPLLCFSRRELQEYLEKNGFDFRQDETNLDLTLIRNRIRGKLLPYIEKEFGVDVSRNLAQLALIAQDENEAISELVEGLWPVVTGGSCSRPELDIEALKEMPVAIARRLVRKFLNISIGLESPSFDQTQAVLALEDGQKFSWGKDKTLIREQGWLRRVEVAKKKAAFSFLWDGKQTVRIHDRWEFQGRFVSAKKLGQPEYDDSKKCYLDADRLALPMKVRSRKPGDKYRPLGLKGEKKLKELLRERKVPQEERDLLPVFVSGGSIIWVPGLPVAEEFKVTVRTKKIFGIEKSDLPG